MNLKQISLILLGSNLVYLACTAASSMSRTTSTTQVDSGTTAATDTGLDSTTTTTRTTVGDSDPSDSAEAATQVNGTRLKVQTTTQTFADGTQRQFDAGLFDTQLGLQCTPMQLSDGNEYCVPYGISAGFYSDATCTTLLAYTTAPASGCSGGTSPKYGVGVSTTSTCGVDTYTIYSLGASPYTGAVYNMNGTTCSLQTELVSSMFLFYTASPLPPSTFVKMTNTVTQ